jgi:hypothetical protein
VVATQIESDVTGIDPGMMIRLGRIEMAQRALGRHADHASVGQEALSVLDIGAGNVNLEFQGLDLAHALVDFWAHDD